MINATKFCTVTKTIKFSLWAVPKFAPQIQNGGCPPSWKIDKFQVCLSTTISVSRLDVLGGNYFSNGSTNFHYILHAGAYWPSEPLRNVQKINFKNPRWQTAAILKNIKYNISAAIWPILMKFGMMMHLRPLNLTGKSKISKFQNPRWRTMAILKIKQMGLAVASIMRDVGSSNTNRSSNIMH